MVTCRYCKEKVSRDEATKIGKSSYYHFNCLKLKEAEKKEKSLESQHYKELIDYICKKHNLKAPTGMMLKQIKDMKENYNYKYSGMLLSLKYFYEIEGNSVLDDTGVGIIHYVYEKAKKHYFLQRQVEMSIKNYEGQETQEVIIDTQKKNKTTKYLIDISTL